MILLFDNLIEGRNLVALRLLLKYQKTSAILGRKGGGREYGNQHSSSTMKSLPVCQVTTFQLHILKWC